MTLSAYFMSKSVFDVQCCRALTLALARLACYYYSQKFIGERSILGYRPYMWHYKLELKGFDPRCVHSIVAFKSTAVTASLLHMHGFLARDSTYAIARYML